MKNEMIQFNLLPDVKIEYMKAQRLKKVITFISTWVTLVSLGVLMLLFLASFVWQKSRLSSLNDEIKSQTALLKGTPDINKILTIQNQLNSLSGLHRQKPDASRSLDFFKNLVPSTVSISRLLVSFDLKTVELSGSAPDLEAVNKFVDTLKFTKFNVKDSGSEATAAFSKVVLASFGRDKTSANYSINFVFDPLLFDGASTTTIIIPNQTTTRSETERPAALFSQPAVDAEGTN